jgi:hypothetical protein
VAALSLAAVSGVLAVHVVALHRGVAFFHGLLLADDPDLLYSAPYETAELAAVLVMAVAAALAVLLVFRPRRIVFGVAAMWLVAAFALLPIVLTPAEETLDQWRIGIADLPLQSLGVEIVPAVVIGLVAAVVGWVVTPPTRAWLAWPELHTWRAGWWWPSGGGR